MLSSFIIHSTASSTCLWSSLPENHEFETRPDREAFSFLFFRTTVTFIVRVFIFFPLGIQLPTSRQLATYFHEVLKIFSGATESHSLLKCIPYPTIQNAHAYALLHLVTLISTQDYSHLSSSHSQYSHLHLHYSHSCFRYSHHIILNVNISHKLPFPSTHLHTMDAKTLRFAVYISYQGVQREGCLEKRHINFHLSSFGGTNSKK